jgi:hypothetical protein
MLILILVWKTTDDAVEKDKAKVKPAAVAAIQPVEVNIDDELMEAANVPDLDGEEDADASFDEDMDELLLGSTAAVAQPSPTKIKIKDLRRPAPDMDDLDAVLYDAADASAANEPAESLKTTEQPSASLPRPKLKVSFGGPSRASAASVPRQSEPYVERTPEPRPAPPIKRESSFASITSADPGSVSRKRAATQGDLEDGSEYPVDATKCEALIQKLTEQQYGWIFSFPVDSTQPGLER